MSWIKDVKEDIVNLDTSKTSLRKFGLLVGSVFIVIALVMFWFAGQSFNVYLLAATGFVLVVSGLLFANLLRPVYLVWMGVAFALGWLVSRVILVFLYFVVITPVALIAKISGKEFLDRSFKNKKETYWIEKGSESCDYKKMH